ncbi:MAG TPA: TonB-dependent receptor [Allosphingosinicella sp.]|jgi:outer membrane receptor protein involved in Fe transport
MQSTLRQRLLASTLIFGAAAVATPAWAQPTDDDIQENAASGVADPTDGEGDDEIVVTGSRIQRRDLTSTSPLAVVQDEEFQLSGATNVEQVLNTLPQVIPGSTGFNNNPGGGVATLQLRGLGATRSLVLVNGRRWMYFDTTQVVDLNTIPQFLIDSVDVVTGGASAVYGSDALAGVVNFRLQTDLEGVQMGANYGITEEGDGRRYGANIAVGSQLADGRGHVIAFAEYYNRGSIFQGDRAFSRFTQQENAAGTAFTPGGSSTTETTRFQYFGGFNANASAATQALLHNRYFIGGNSRLRVGTDLYNYAPGNYLMVPQERWLLGGYGEYQISDHVTAFTEVSFVNNRVANELAPTPVTGFFNVNIAQACTFVTAADCARFQQADAGETAANAADNDPLTPGVQTLPDDPGVINTFVQRRITETGARNALDERNAFRALAGVRGPITDTLNYEAYYFFSRTRNSQIQEGNISQSAFQAGLDGTGTPLNIFAPGLIAGDALDAIAVPTQNSDIANLQVASASINGSLGETGWGGADPIGFAIGGEWRSVSARFVPDQALGSGDIIGFNAGAPTAGGYNVAEVFAEVRIPIVADVPGFHRLELNGAARYSDYSLEAVGGVWTYAAGAEWSPVPDLTFRGQYQRAIRAPNVDDLFQGSAVGFPPATDPCAQAAAATNATVRALCVATGVPNAQVGNPNLQINPQIPGIFGGNPDLQEERANTWTVGAVIRPSFIPGLNITIDGYDIEIDNVISTLGGGAANILNLCYNVVQNAASPYCQAINRNSAGIISGDEFSIEVLNANIARLTTRGIDLSFDYSMPLGFSMVGGEESRLNFFFLGTYTDEYNITAVSDLPDEINECAGRFGVLACGEPIPRYKWSSRLSLIDGPMTLTGRWRHIGSVRDDDDDTDYLVETIGATDYFDLAFAFDVSDGLRLTMGVNNLLDTGPEVLGLNQEQANTWPNTYEVIGRDFFISANLRF